MPRFMMGALAVTSVCVGYLLATRWDDEVPADGMQAVAQGGPMGKSSVPNAVGLQPRDDTRPASVYGDVPLGI